MWHSARLDHNAWRCSIPRDLKTTRAGVERAFLVTAVQSRGRVETWAPEDSLKELGELAHSAGAQVVGSMIQRMDRPTKTYLGSGKLTELKSQASARRADTVICDDELTPAQQRHVENALDGTKVIDRTALILDVFGRRARTREGRLQVELAQHEYLLPRLAGQWSHLERLGGGIGTRGPGETQLETDRRLVRGRIKRLKKSLEDVRRHRGLYRSRRAQQGLPVASLVGYTNAGKSTLLNRLTGADVLAEDRLFSTLDPVTRRILLPSGRYLLVTDTVGFIQKLPTTVVAAFSATLEEATESAMIVHVVDITHPNAAEQADVVHAILTQLHLSDKPTILALNKTDLFHSRNGVAADATVQQIVGERDRTVAISALRGTGLDDLVHEMDRLVQGVDAPAVSATS